jgi:peptidyl-prolyl cis-trans isomerase B (cyclophilin B)
MVVLHTNFGDITIKMFEQEAPNTVKNFLEYANAGFYNGTIFHRVIDGFMVQGGGFVSGMEQKDVNDPIQNEANNGLSNKVGTLATAQFFINVNNNDFLNHSSETSQGWGYCVFAEVVEGMDIVEKIKGVATGSNGFHQDVPLEDVIIESVTVN